MSKIFTGRHQRGEIASLLTVVSMVVLSVGLIFGYQISKNAQTINPKPFAAAPVAVSPIPNDGVSTHDEVCFPGGDKDQQVRDKYCRTRMYPASLLKKTIEGADSRAKKVFNTIFSGTENAKQNPFVSITTAKDQRTLQIYGGLCLDRSSIAGKSKLSTEDVEVYVSLFGVRKYYDDKGLVGIESLDKNDALRYKLAAAEDKSGSNNTDELFVAKAREEVCTFTNGSTDATNYKKTDNPLLFDIQVSKKSIENAIERTKADKTLNQKFDAEKCELYIHLRDNISAGDGSPKPKDTYNIYKLDLRDILGDQVKEICEPVVTPPTGTVTPTDSVTPSVPTTPTATPPDITATPTTFPGEAACFESCTPSTTCGLDTKTGNRMTCYNTDWIGTGSTPPSLSTCADADINCKCLPSKCVTNPKSCTSYEAACPPSEPKITPQASVTPTSVLSPSPTPTTATPSPVACTFNALAYVQECTQLDANGQCIRGADGRFVAKAINTSPLGTLWGASNNKQIAGGRYGANPATPFIYEQNTFVGAFDKLKLEFPYLNTYSFSEITYINYNATASLPAGKNPLEPGSAYDLTPEGRAKNPILIAPINNFPNEQYFNQETANVRLFANFSSKDYRIVPDGNEIKYCGNTIAGTQSGACDQLAFDAHRVDPGVDKNVRDTRDTIDGLKVGCGQNIVYGWTIQKCNTEPADYLFVVDVSTSMNKGIDLTGVTKLQAAKKSLNAFVDSLKTYSKDSRAALIQFSSIDNTKTLEAFTPNLDTIKSAVNNKLVVKEGTCIENGMEETLRVLQTKAGSNRKTYIVFLTDGLPNCPNGTPSEKSISLIKAHGETLRKMAGVSTYSIGFGDPQKDGVGADVQLFDVVKLIASSEKQAFSTTRDLNIDDVYKNIAGELNSCARSEALYQNYVTSQDINGDGVINTIDLFMIYDNYFERGANVPEDLNDDQVVNSLDVSIIINNMGKTITQENNTAQKSVGDVFN